jgi:hypothetical protein
MSERKMTYDDLFDFIRDNQIEISKRPNDDPRKHVLVALNDLMFQCTEMMRAGELEPAEVVEFMRGWRKADRR